MAQKLCISGDSHVVEPAEVFAGLEARFGEAAPKIVHDPERGDVLTVNGRGGLSVGRLGIAGHYVNDPATQAMIRQGYAGMRPGVMDPIARLKDQDIDGINAEVIYPSVMFGVYGIPNAEIVAATFRNYNDWTAN